MKRVLLVICKVGQLLRFRALRTKGHAGAHPNQPTSHSAADLVWAENQLIKWDQESHFPELIQDLMNNKAVTINSAAMKKLHPFLDEERILRVGGRLGHLDDDYNTKYPKILPRSDLTKLIIREMHLSLLHPGPQLLLAHCRRRYWPIGGRHITRNVVHMCKACFVHKTSRENQIMADLPKHRISLVRAFSSVAIDCCGPFFIRTGAESRGRTQRIDIVVFVCTSTKAVHLEIVSSLSSEAFMSSFRRFTSRRGVCKEVFSDNGRNFLGASRELQRLLAEEAQTIQDQTINQNITWHFQPARSPHFNSSLHFLLLAPPTQLPDENLASVRMNHLTRWQLCQRIVQDFVRKWRLSYLHTLQERSKWHTEKVNLKVDDIVILHDASIGNTKWTTGRVVGVHTGADGKVRVIDIKTPTGTYTRSVTKVAKLPTCESHNLPREHV
ncbi:uncharacterized protein LOC129808497 [Phlebotomus papatasi]|uniref:uncharacterized protein LOC129808497 n=1 Tax=Phlebotomus papatasi TaxID=29031 RepID=UPI0024838319|nr:uncharacterized protein LOC129808497 [Phlebotomus papatasi]